MAAAGQRFEEGAPRSRATTSFRSRGTILGLQVSVGAVLVVAWEFMSGRFVDARLVSRPSEVLATGLEWISDGTLLNASIATLYVVTVGLILGILTGLAAGILVASIPPLDWTFEPMIRVLFALPKIALVPLAILWFGISYQQRIILTAIVVFFFIFYATYQGYKNVPESLRQMLDIQGVGPLRRVWVLYLPASAGWILGGLRISVPYAFIGAVTPEIIASREGLGHLIKQSATFVQPAGMFVAIIVLGTLAVLASVGTERIARTFGPRFFGEA